MKVKEGHLTFIKISLVKIKEYFFRVKSIKLNLIQDTDGTLTAPLDANGNGGEGHRRNLGKPGSKVVASAAFYDGSKCADGTSGGKSFTPRFSLLILIVSVVSGHHGDHLSSSLF